MSIHGKLQDMMTSKEAGTFYMKDKKNELKIINEAFFAPLANVGSLIHSAVKTVSKVSSKVGQGIQKVVDTIDTKNFEKKTGFKTLEDLDEKLTAMKVNDPDFYALMGVVLKKVMQAKNFNPELYKDLSPIFDKHVTRLVNYFSILYSDAKDDQQAMMYYGILMSLMNWLDKERNKSLREHIKETISDRLDKKTLEATKRGPDFKKPLTKEEQDIINDIDNVSKKMATTKVSDPDFFENLKNISGAMVKTSEENKIYPKLKEAFDNNSERYVDFYEKLLRNTKDENKSATYSAQLQEFLNFLGNDHKRLRDSINDVIVQQFDRKTINAELGKESDINVGGREATETQDFFDKFGNLPDISERQLNKMSVGELQTFIKHATEFEDEQIPYVYTKSKDNPGATKDDILDIIKDKKKIANDIIAAKNKK